MENLRDSLREQLQEERATWTRAERALDNTHALQDCVIPAEVNSTWLNNIADPDEFADKREEYKVFKHKCWTKLNGESSRFCDEQHRVQYITSYLSGDAYAMIQPYMTKTGISLPTISALWKILDGAYDDPDKQQTAERELRKLRQSNREFSTYLANFNKWMAVAQWDTTAKRSQLLEGLSEEMQDALQ